MNSLLLSAMRAHMTKVAVSPEWVAARAGGGSADLLPTRLNAARLRGVQARAGGIARDMSDVGGSPAALEKRRVLRDVIGRRADAMGAKVYPSAGNNFGMPQAAPGRSGVRNSMAGTSAQSPNAQAAQNLQATAARSPKALATTPSAPPTAVSGPPSWPTAPGERATVAQLSKTPQKTPLTQRLVAQPSRVVAGAPAATVRGSGVRSALGRLTRSGLGRAGMLAAGVGAAGLGLSALRKPVAGE